MSTVTRRSSLLALVALGTLAATTLVADVADASTVQKLFFITRSKNAAEVHYDARVRADGTLEPSDTVVGYWRNVAPDGTVSTNSIGTFEKIAYGWDTEATGNGTYAFHMRAFKERPMWIVKVADRYRLQTNILGKQAYMTKLYVKTDESGMIPKVLFVDVYGEDAASGAPLMEHIVKS